ncbi:MAG: formate/nitrite transporter family protein [Bdellovibrionales bacterium]
MSQQNRINDKLRLHSATIYEIVAREGSAELSRKLSALGWSGLAAGFCISFSMLAEAYIKMYVPDTPYRPLIENMGYTFGFIIVIMARLQLFTENTITVMLPVFENPAWRNVWRTLRLWGVVFATNLVGTFIVAVLLTKFHFASPAQLSAVLEVSHHAIHRDIWDVFIQGIPAGFLIATLVWMLPSADSNEFFVIFLMTYLIAIGDFTHVVAGSAEAFTLMLAGDISIAGAFGYIGAAGLGNIVGGTGLFALLAYAQVKDEI